MDWARIGFYKYLVFEPPDFLNRDQQYGFCLHKQREDILVFRLVEIQSVACRSRLYRLPEQTPVNKRADLICCVHQVYVEPKFKLLWIGGRTDSVVPLILRNSASRLDIGSGDICLFRHARVEYKPQIMYCIDHDYLVTLANETLQPLSRQIGIHNRPEHPIPDQEMIHGVLMGFDSTSMYLAETGKTWILGILVRQGQKHGMFLKRFVGLTVSASHVDYGQHRLVDPYSIQLSPIQQLLDLESMEPQDLSRYTGVLVTGSRIVIMDEGIEVIEQKKWQTLNNSWMESKACSKNGLH